VLLLFKNYFIEAHFSKYCSAVNFANISLTKMTAIGAAAKQNWRMCRVFLIFAWAVLVPLIAPNPQKVNCLFGALCKLWNYKRKLSGFLRHFFVGPQLLTFAANFRWAGKQKYFPRLKENSSYVWQFSSALFDICLYSICIFQDLGV